MADTSKLHPATTVTNIKSCIPIVLDYEGSQYNNWATLFKLHCRVNLVIDHILPPASPTVPPPATAAEKLARKALWERLDDIVRQWIYGTISNDLLNTIIHRRGFFTRGMESSCSSLSDNKSAGALLMQNSPTPNWWTFRM
ncbi:uncharacterized protein LOC132043811 [Lycium ferocissimum]|uniref:uncharacterized protein LOC132043811 n=1 Tax=Lycium ferocissimum TaxID=112874 RepID=UPI002815D704|nr:uncharacterized protein LOC132043811 [Lycium ferocissimum]